MCVRCPSLRSGCSPSASNPDSRGRAHGIARARSGPAYVATGAFWGVPWASDSPQPQDRQFPGLAFCVGGRSVFWGGWAPHHIDSEVASWPASVRTDLMTPVLSIGYLIWLPIEGGLVLKAREIWPRANRVFCAQDATGWDQRAGLPRRRYPSVRCRRHGSGGFSHGRC